MIHHALPLKVSRAVVGQSYREGAEALLEFLRIQMTSLTGYHTGLPVHQAYGNSQKETLVQMIMAGGIRQEFVPLSLGGSFHVDSAFDEFMRRRWSLEDVMGWGDGIATLSPAVPQELIVHTASKRMPLKRRNIDMPNNDNETKDDTTVAQRDRNALYARRSYHRKQMRRVELLEQVRAGHELNEAARQEGRRLELLLNQANLIVGFLEQIGTISLSGSLS